MQGGVPTEGVHHMTWVRSAVLHHPNIGSTSVGSVAVHKQVKPKHQRLMKLKARLAKSGEHLQTVELLYSTSPDGGLDLDRSTQGGYI